MKYRYTHYTYNHCKYLFKNYHTIIALLGVFYLSISSTPVHATFFDATGAAGIRSGRHFNTNAGLSSSTRDYQATEKHFHLNLEVKPGDLVSVYSDIRFWPTMKSVQYMGDHYGSSRDYELDYEENLTSPAEQRWYKPLNPTVTQLYFEAATRYCLFSVGRRGRDLGLGIFLDSGQDPFDTTQNTFDGISCDVNTGSWRRLGVSLGADKLREGSPLHKEDDAHQLYASISYDDRQIYDGLPVRKQISLYFAYLDSVSPYSLGKVGDRYFDIFTGLYWGYFSLEAEGLIRMGEASGKSWEKLGGRRNKVSTLNSLAVHSELTFTYPPIYPFGHRDATEDAYLDNSEVLEESLYVATSASSPATLLAQNTSADNASTDTTDDNNNNKKNKEGGDNEVTDDTNEEDSYLEPAEEMPSFSDENQLTKGDTETTPSAEMSHEQDHINNTPEERQEERQEEAYENQASTYLSSLPSPSQGASSSPTLTNHHRVTLGYTYSPGDSQGYFKGDDAELSQAKRSQKVTALPLNKNFKPALILFNMRNSIMDIDGIYSGDQVVNAHVFSTGYSYFNGTYGNIHLKVIGAMQDQGIPAIVKSYFYYSKYDYLPEDYYAMPKNQAYPVGYSGRYLGTEVNLSYDIALTDYLKWGLAGGILFVGNALDVLVDTADKANIIAVESSLILQF
ncbi:MAG: hypothetical protein OXC44_01170 [Proteobacteria bacterium]|nr:hypothetical protein [Pseudomonadota bacterium]